MRTFLFLLKSVEKFLLTLIEIGGDPLLSLQGKQQMFLEIFTAFKQWLLIEIKIILQN